MGTPSPPPRSLRPRTEDFDENWDDVFDGALQNPGVQGPDADVDPDVFDRTTTIPSSPPPLSPSDRAPPTVPNDPHFPARGGDPPELGGRLPVRAASPKETSAAQDVPTLKPRMPNQPPEADAALSRRRADASAFDRRRTAPEPIVERFLDRVDAGAAAPAERSGQRPEFEALELDLSGGDDSPLELAETYRRATESLPAAVAADPNPDGPTEGREGGTRQDMQDRYAVGDFTGALVVAESILDSDPENEDARRYAQSCREVLTQMYAARIGTMDQVATVAVPPDQITWLSLDHRAGFLLSLVDGVSSIEEILDISGMTRLDALRIMYTLVQQNVITLS